MDYLLKIFYSHGFKHILMSNKRIYIPLLFLIITLIETYITIVSFFYEGLSSPFYIIISVVWVSIAIYFIVKYRRSKYIFYSLLGVILLCFSFLGILFIKIFVISPKIPDFKIKYEKIEKTAHLKNEYNLKIFSNNDIFIPIDSLKFSTIYLKCPINDEGNKTVYLTDDCFNCNNIQVQQLNKKFHYTIPTKFVINQNHTETPVNEEEVLSYFAEDSCIECKIIYTKMYGNSKSTNSFKIPSKDLINILGVQ